VIRKRTVNEAKFREISKVVHDIKAVTNICDSICQLENTVARLLKDG
jgi:hypothetical protein